MNYEKDIRIMLTSIVAQVAAKIPKPKRKKTWGHTQERTMRNLNNLP